ncbi:MAG: hypothetical protein IPK82_11820 [Polyangiaceae bacterium]|nr:hypothetical protein [Polyangiaceae bacterium]
MRALTAVQAAAIFGVVGSVLAVAIPGFVRNLSASKLSEPIDGLDRMVTNAIGYAETHPHEISFPPSAPLTPAQVPRGVRATDPPEVWEHLTWKSLQFGFTEAHAFAFQFTTDFDPNTQVFRFTATSHGDLDGDGMLSTFEVKGERLPGQSPKVLPGMFVDHEVE